MNKIICCAIASVMLLSGCSEVKQEHSKDMHTKMFQSVSKDQATLVQEGKNKQYCVICGMDLVKFYKTSHASVDKNGKNYQYCSIHCLEDHLAKGTDIKDFRVVDVKSLKLIHAKEATYVVGSKVHGTMSRVSKYAFLNKEDAKTFQAEHGGEIMDFDSALKKAKEDFDHQMKH